MTDSDLTSALVSDLTPVRTDGPSRQLAFAVAGGAVVTMLLVIGWLGVQPGLMGAGAGPFAMKALYTLTLAGVAFATAQRLARPGGRPLPLVFFLAPPAAMAILALATTPMASPGAAAQAVMGSSWNRCPLMIFTLAIPIFAGAVLALRRQAPTRLGLTGAAAGLLAGGGAAALYALACTEAAPAFVALWYTLGVGASTAAGALLGPRLLRW